MSNCGGMNSHGGSEDSGKASYLFTKSLKGLQNKDVLSEELRLLKSQVIGNQHGQKPSSTSGDPVLHYVLGFAKLPSNEDIIDYYRQNSNGPLDDSARAQICVFLNKGEYAMKPADLDGQLAKKWLESFRQKDEASFLEAERTGFILHFMAGQKVSTLCEMAARGNLWDAFVLMSLLYPDHEVMGLLRSFVWKTLDLKWIDDLNSEPSEPPSIEVLMNLGINTMECYQTLKTNLKTHKDNAFVRSVLYSSMRVFLLSSVCEAEEGTSSDMMKDYYRFIGSEPIFLQEGLPGLQKTYFEQSSIVIQDVIRVVLHLCNVAKNDEVAKYEDDSFGVLSNLVDSWLKRGILPRDSTLAETRKGISDVVHSFIGDVLDAPEIINNGNKYKVYVLLALLIAEVLFRSNVSNSNGVLIFDLLAKCDFKEELINRLLKKISSPTQVASPSEKMISSVRDCLLRVRNMFSQQTHFQMQSTASSHAEHLNLNTAVESVVAEKDLLKTAEVEATIKKSSDNTVSGSGISAIVATKTIFSGDLDSGSSLYRSPSTEEDLVRLGKLQNKVVQDSQLPADHNQHYESRIQPEAIVSQDDMLVTQLTTKWEQPDTNVTQAPHGNSNIDQIGNVESHLSVPSTALDKLFEQATANLSSQIHEANTVATKEMLTEKVVEQVVLNDASGMMNSVGGNDSRIIVEATQVSVASSTEDTLPNNGAYVAQPVITNLPSVPSTSCALPSIVVDVPTPQAVPVTSNSQPVNVEQVSMFSSHFQQQQQSGWGSDDEDSGKNTSFGFASQASGDNGSSNFGGNSRGGGGYGGDRGGDRGGYGGNRGDRGSYGGNRGDRGSYGGNRGDRGSYGGDRGGNRGYGGDRGSYGGNRGGDRGGRGRGGY